MLTPDRLISIVRRGAFLPSEESACRLQSRPADRDSKMRPWFLVMAFLGAVVGGSLSFAPPAHAQFGKNKVQYKDFRWSVIPTEHFDIYYYEGESDAALRAARMAERAYVRLSRILRHDIEEKVPVILYASHSDFQQTNIAQGLIPEGVGGITEFTKRRVFLPFTGSYGEFDHVLTHELVHAFQTDILFGTGAEANPFAFQPPLWFMEGMAEYLSLGGVDAHTEMWLRWTALEGQLIPLVYMDQIADIRVYRIGQGIFAFLGEKYGDAKIGELLRLTAYHRSVDLAMEKTLGVSRQILSEEWEEYVKRKYFPQITNLNRPDENARRMTHGHDESHVQLAPSLSPDGSLLAYIEDGRFSTDIMLASGIDGKVLDRLLEGERSADFESLRYFYTSIGWSPDGSRIAFPSKRGGEDVLNLFDVHEKRVLETLSFQLDGLVSPSFHPGGNKIVFSGVSGGESNLFVVELSSRELTRLTEGPYFERDPQWSPDGKKVAFVTDRGEATNLERLEFGASRIAIMDVETGTIELMANQAGKNISPQWSPDGKLLAFVSDRDGISNLYIQDLGTNELFRLTQLLTGVTGIIESSPPFSWSRNGRRIVYTTFQGQGWDLYQIDDPMDAMIEVDQPVSLADLAARERSLWSPASFPSESIAGVPFLDEAPPALPAPPVPSVGKELPPEHEAPSESTSVSTETMVRGLLDDIPGHTPLPTWGPFAPDAPAFMFEVAQGDSAKLAPKRGPELDLATIRSETVTALPEISTLEPRRYKLKWAPDYLSAAPVFASNVGFAGQAVVSFSDILSNHILQFGASVYGSFSDSDLLMSYYNLSNRTNWGVTLFQYRNDFGIFTAPDRLGFESQIYRGFQASLSRPFSKFSRFELQARGIAVSETVFEQSFVSSSYVETEEIDSSLIYYAEPGVALVMDQVIYGWDGPRHGRRARLSVDQAFGDIQATTTIGDYRQYFALGESAVFATRLIGGASSGKTPRLFRIGGAQTLRGLDYGELEGSSLALANLEFRFPLISTLRLGWPLRIGLGGIGGAFFFDLGSAWDRSPRVFRNGALDDFSAGYGFGLRLGLGYFSLKYDIAQRTNLKKRLGDSESYFTIGVDF